MKQMIRSLRQTLRTHLVAVGLAVVTVLAVTQVARSGIVILAGSGVNIPANTTTAFTSVAQVGTFSLNPQYVYVTTQNGVTATNAMVITGRLTFDGTNFFNILQPLQFSALGSQTNVLWTTTNQVLPVYSGLAVSNGQATTITNFSAVLQF